MKKLTFILCGIIIAGVSVVLFAQSVKDDLVFRRFDKNQDGKVTPEELPNAGTFATFDRNKDGTITLDEYRQVNGGAPASDSTAPANVPGASAIDAIAKAADKNKDGKITRAEAAGAKWFDRLDQNADGVIDAQELAIVKQVVARAGAGGRGMPVNAPTITAEDVQTITSGPEVLKPGDVGIGRMMDDIAFTAMRDTQCGNGARPSKVPSRSKILTNTSCARSSASVRRGRRVRTMLMTCG